jgi:hypothetical protein
MTAMNAHISCLAMAALAATATATLDAPAAGGEKEHSVSARTMIISGDETSSAGGSHTFEITVDNGKVTVIVDGEELPANRFQIEGGRLLILDEEGRELKSLGVMLGEGDEDFHMTWAGDEPLIEYQKLFPEGRPSVLVGVHMTDPDQALRYHLGLEEGQATMISGLYRDLPAHKAGLDQFDVIVAVDGNRPADPKSIMQALADKEPGDEVKFTVIHKGRTTEYSVTLEAYDPARMDPSKLIGGGAIISRITIPGGEVEIVPGLPGREGWQWLIDPESRQRFKWLERLELPEGYQMDLREELRQRIPQDLDERIEVLNERIEEMREMIDRLVEQARELAEERDEG